MDVVVENLTKSFENQKAVDSISFKAKTYSKDKTYAIYPDVVKEIEKDKLDYKFIKRHGTCSTLRFYAKVAWFYRKKITVSKLAFYLRKKANLAVKRGFN